MKIIHLWMGAIWKAIMTTVAQTYDRPIKAIYYVLAGVFVFSIQDVIIKKISGLYPVHEIVFIRSFFAIMLILLLARLEGGLKSLRTKHLKVHIIRALILFGAYTRSSISDRNALNRRQRIIYLPAQKRIFKQICVKYFQNKDQKMIVTGKTKK